MQVYLAFAVFSFSPRVTSSASRGLNGGAFAAPRPRSQRLFSGCPSLYQAYPSQFFPPLHHRAPLHKLTPHHDHSSFASWHQVAKTRVLVSYSDELRRSILFQGPSQPHTAHMDWEWWCFPRPRPENPAIYLNPSRDLTGLGAVRSPGVQEGS
ncbi:uncharacterized protein CCOS01_00391 [Colletotrichum costaricense]|uniref:Uncharacterized protein n=2 Tax=Colletotrichum acutatum species complex TaxID=2707335 RepID=A0AAI9ZAR6_9PEZI|nr:uncharacterized protein CCOS01_00391 [Colletotrichum costaricense]XP_060378410.1 uncharacterized protein CTAM01_10907 [Colletotrichum tamarilloi]KAI3547911.1 hypothetical protein CSPX01_03488 [Colletotrichum filicis]KAK1490057.1 hypothetical protein CTAM01_10907 [Colletotrichum tamarilloi]KAK1539077.1 hypothetical protein CCOS01_00391 [Colletotrichum costaricense]